MRSPNAFIKPSLAVVAAAFGLATLVAAPREAAAQRREYRGDVLSMMGHRRTLVIDQISGFRMSTIGGVNYAGPIGLAFQSVGENSTVGGVTASTTLHYTNFWFAPSADYFIIDHLSIGGLLEVVTTSISRDTQANVAGNSTIVSTSLPATTNVTFIPRVGYLFGITDRFGIWPRGGIGYGSRQELSNILGNGTARDTLYGFLFDIDVGFLYRVTESFFLRAAPEFTFGLGPSHSSTATVGGTTTSVSNDASLFQFAITGGIGVMWDL